MLALHFVLNDLNTRKNYRLFKKWMKLTYEMPVTSDADYEVVGLPREENRRFWEAEDDFNYRYLAWGATGCLVVICFVFDAQLFFVSFPDASLPFYALMQTINVLHNTLGVFAYLHGFYSPNTFLITIILFMTKKLRHIRKQLERMNVSLRTRQINNRKLATLVYEYHYVQMEITEMNNFFKYASLPASFYCNLSN